MPDASHPASPTVFISSTVREFRDLRSALYYTLRSQGISVYLSEASDFDVRGDRSAIEECFENIRVSDFYVLIVGGRRGSLFDEDVSVTRQEYRVAREQYLATGKPSMLLFLRGETEVALSGNIERQKEEGIDNPDHLTSFIDEIQTSSYLKRFRDFGDVMG